MPPFFSQALGKMNPSAAPSLRRSHARAWRLLRVGLLAATYATVLGASLAAALLLRFDFDVPPEFWERYRLSAFWIIPLKLLLLAAFGQYRSLLTFFSFPEAKRIALAMAAAALVETAVWFAVQGRGVVPRGVIVTDLVLSFVALAALRASMRLYRETKSATAPPRSAKRKRALIAGAGTSGAALLRELKSKPGTGVDVVGFLDDDPAKSGGTVHAVPVLGPLRDLPAYASRLEAKKIIIAIPSASPAAIRALVASANDLGLEHDILPSVAQLLHQRVTVNHLRPVEPDDLLARPPMALDDTRISEMIAGQTVLVTGAGGSIGSELCRQIAAKSPGLLLLVDRSEPALFAIEQELRAAYPEIRIAPLAHDILDEQDMDGAFREFRPSLVFHAAAHKHVPLMEAQPATAIRNNALGTLAVARAAARHGARKFVLISTDKALTPSSVMGATKKLAELVVREIQNAGRTACCFATVRFGNVLGSSGSVVPIFHRQIARGGPVTVTHPDATRYFMSLPEATGLILQSALLAKGGEVFALDMGEPVKILDLARQMIELSGLVPGGDIAIEATGLRPGEKVHEECAHRGDGVIATTHPGVKMIVEEANGAGTASALESLVSEMSALPRSEILRRLEELVPGYRLGSAP